MKFKQNEIVTSQYGKSKILRIEEQPKNGVAGIYSIEVLEKNEHSGFVYTNYPGYLLKKKLLRGKP